MCIALISTAHPSYSLIIIDNRDEYLRRRTSSADWWPDPHAHILSSRDLARSTQGTWMGVTTEGKVAVLTNYRENTSDQASGVHSRGAIVNSWLTDTPGRRVKTEDFVRDLVSSDTLHTVGGFSLVCGYVNEPLAIVSNRSSDLEHVAWVAGENESQQTRGLSNTSFGDRSWPKILDGEKLMEEAISAHAETGENEDALIGRLLGVLSTDTLPRLPEHTPAAASIHLLRKSIFVPVIGAKEGHHSTRSADEVAAACLGDKMGVCESASDGKEDNHGNSQGNGNDTGKGNGSGNPGLDQSYMSGAYGTQKQTVLLVESTGQVRYFERTLYDNDVKPIPVGRGDRSFEFVAAR